MIYYKIRKQFYHVAAICCCTFILGGSALSTAAFFEYWPFTNFPMYSVSQPEFVWIWFRLIGTKEDNTDIELNRHIYTAPFDYVKFSYVSLANYKKEQPELNVALLKTIYELSLKTGNNSLFSPFRKIKIQRIVWATNKIVNFNYDKVYTKKDIACYDIKNQKSCD